MILKTCRQATRFQSTPPCGGDLPATSLSWGATDFNPRPLAGATGPQNRRINGTRHFNPRPLAGATLPKSRQGWLSADFNPRPLAGATKPPTWAERLIVISIHAPLRGRLPSHSGPPGGPDFNPRPLAGATDSQIFCVRYSPDFNPRPLAGATGLHGKLAQFKLDFNPRPLAGATRPGHALLFCPAISIHAPLRGRRGCHPDHRQHLYFNPRPLAGATSTILSGHIQHYDFNPRPLAGATTSIQSDFKDLQISIHAPLRGRRMTNHPYRQPPGFQSTPPCGGDYDKKIVLPCLWISIHAPLRGRPRFRGPYLRRFDISIHAPLRGRLDLNPGAGSSRQFQSTPPCGGDCCWLK